MRLPIVEKFLSYVLILPCSLGTSEYVLGLLIEWGLFKGGYFPKIQILPILGNTVKVCFSQKVLVKWSKCHLCEPNIAPELLCPVNGMNGSDKMVIFSFFCIIRIKY